MRSVEAIEPVPVGAASVVSQVLFDAKRHGQGNVYVTNDQGRSKLVCLRPAQSESAIFAIGHYAFVGGLIAAPKFTAVQRALVYKGS